MFSPFTFKDANTLPVSIIPDEKSDIILILVLLYVMYILSLYFQNIFFTFGY